MTSNHAPKRHAVPKKPAVASKSYHPNIHAIFITRYRVEMYTRDIMSIELQREIGALATGDKKIDARLSSQKQFTYLSINDMVEYYRNGVPMYLQSEHDAKTIYEAVLAHTGEWRDALRFAFNLGASPVEDLILLESFVSSIYKHAKFSYHQRPEFNAASGTLAEFLYSKSSLPGISYINSVQSIARDENVSKQNLKELEYEPNIDVFRDAMMRNLGVNRQ